MTETREAPVHPGLCTLHVRGGPGPATLDGAVVRVDLRREMVEQERLPGLDFRAFRPGRLRVVVTVVADVPDGRAGWAAGLAQALAAVGTPPWSPAEVEALRRHQAGPAAVVCPACWWALAPDAAGLECPGCGQRQAWAPALALRQEAGAEKDGDADGDADEMGRAIERALKARQAVLVAIEAGAPARGRMPCPAGCGAELYYARHANGHVWARCDTPGCLHLDADAGVARWLE